MDHNEQEQVALHRWAAIAEAAGETLTARERGALVRQIAVRAHPHPDGSSRRYLRGTVDRWLLNLSRTVIYEQLRAGRLRSVQQGRARLIAADAIRDTSLSLRTKRRRRQRDNAEGAR